MRKQKITLILGPGGLPGAAYEIGGLLALEDFIGTDIINVVDEFQGSSCGAMISFALMANFDTRSLYSALYPDHPYYFGLSDLYSLNLLEIARSTLAFPYHLGKIIARLFSDRVKLYERLTVPIQEMPLSGLFVTNGIQDYIERICDDFSVPKLYGEFCKARRKNLYLLTTDLGTGEPRILDPVHYGNIELKKAIAASATVAPLFKPVELKNGSGVPHKLADGAFAMSLGIRHAYERGGGLLIYFNPLKPTTVSSNVHNVFDIFEQLYRIPAHTRKSVAESDHRAHHPGTLFGFEPDTDTMFHNLFRSDLRLDYADHGYISTLRKLHRSYTAISEALDKHGVSVVSRRRLGTMVKEFKPGETLLSRRKQITQEKSLCDLALGQSAGWLESVLSGISNK